MMEILLSNFVNLLYLHVWLHFSAFLPNVIHIVADSTKLRIACYITCDSILLLIYR